MKKFLALTFVFFLSFIFYHATRVIIYFPYTPSQLVVSQNAVSADLIVVASGEMERVEYAFELAEAGFADTIFYSSGYIEKYQREYISKNIVEGITFISTSNSISTYTDAVLTKKFIAGKNIKKIILVTSPQHSYRAYKTFSKVLPRITLLSVPVANSSFSLDDAENNNKSFSYRLFRSEQFKYLFYSLKYGI